jgi:hypothetical protein
MDAPEERDGEGRGTTMRRRRVAEAAVALVVVAVFLFDGLDPVLRWSASAKKLIALGLLIGMPIAIGVAWYESRGRRSAGSEPSSSVQASAGSDVQILWTRLPRSKVFMWGAACVVLSGLLDSWLDVAVDGFDWPDVTRGLVDLVLLLALPIVLVLAWYHGDRGRQRVTAAEGTLIAVLCLIAGGVLWHYPRFVAPGVGLTSLWTSLWLALFAMSRFLIARAKAQGASRMERLQVRYMSLLCILMMLLDAGEYGLLSVLPGVLLISVSVVLVARGRLMQRFVRDGHTEGPTLFMLLVALPIGLIDAWYHSDFGAQALGLLGFAALLTALCAVGLAAYWFHERRSLVPAE